MMSVVIVFGGLAVVVGTLLAVDWFVAGRRERRRMVRAHDQQVGDKNVDLAMIQREAQSDQTQGNTGI